MSTLAKNSQKTTPKCCVRTKSNKTSKKELSKNTKKNFSKRFAEQKLLKRLKWGLKIRKISKKIFCLKKVKTRAEKSKKSKTMDKNKTISSGFMLLRKLSKFCPHFMQNEAKLRHFRSEDSEKTTKKSSKAPKTTLKIQKRHPKYW